tara:strand:+ start:244 stop:591 length:348 start_codon:yes stop_codon:yes gene_type:complete
VQGLFPAVGKQADFGNYWISRFGQSKACVIGPIFIKSMLQKQKVPQLKQLTAQTKGKWHVVAQRLANPIDKPRAAPPTQQLSGVAEGFIVVLEIRPIRVFASLAFDELWVGNILL